MHGCVAAGLVLALLSGFYSTRTEAKLSLVQQRLAQDQVTVLSTDYLSVDSATKTFVLNGKSVFLSGVNQPWVNYGNDFGNNQPNSVFCQLNETLQNVTMSSGNSVRMWVHCEGVDTPYFDSNGYVIGTDKANTLINDMRLYLTAASNANVLVLFSLWNGAQPIRSQVLGLMQDTSKLQSYLNNALIPMVKGLSDLRSIAGWEIVNEPEGSVQAGVSNSQPCFDTRSLQGTGAGWTGSNIPMQQWLRFINWQAAAIHQAQPGALVTVGSWSEHASTDNFGYTNYYKDSCLQAAGGQAAGTLDYYQMHSYRLEGPVWPLRTVQQQQRHDICQVRTGQAIDNRRVC